MEFGEFQALVERLEARAIADPAGYRHTVGLLALAGYGYIALVLLFLVGTIAGLIWAIFELHAAGIAFKLVLPFVVVLGALLKAVWVNFQRPEGIEIDLATVPGLAAMVEDVRRAARGPRLHRVLLTTELNASVVQHPRLGVFGWFENHLILGMPLLQTLPAEEVRAVLAHEFGHLAGSHGRFGAWIYRQRLIYSRFEAEIVRQKNRIGAALLAPLRRWYFPYFNAYSFALARHQEYEADALAAEVTGTATARVSLARIAVLAGWEQPGVWNEIDREAQRGAPIPHDVYSRYPAKIRETLSPERIDALVAQALLVPTDYHDSHPALRDRLRALGEGPAPVVRWDAATTLGTSLLHPREEELLAAANERWRSANVEVWERRGAQIAAAQKRLTELDARADAGTLTKDQRWERVELTETLSGLSAAAVLARQLLATDPGLNGARFLVARALLADGDESGLMELDEVVAREPGAAGTVAQVAFPWLWGRGRREEAEQWRRRGHQGEVEAEAATVERRTYDTAMVLAPHGRPEEEVVLLRAGVAGVAGVRAIYFVRRVVRHQPDRPCWIVGVIPDFPWYHRIKPGELGALTKAVLASAPWPIETRIIPLALELKPLRKRFRRVPGAILLER